MVVEEGEKEKKRFRSPVTWRISAPSSLRPASNSIFFFFFLSSFGTIQPSGRHSEVRTHPQPKDPSRSPPPPPPSFVWRRRDEGEQWGEGTSSECHWIVLEHKVAEGAMMACEEHPCPSSPFIYLFLVGLRVEIDQCWLLHYDSC